MGSTKSRFYRPELDAVRFFAFLLVFLEHTLGEPFYPRWWCAIPPSFSIGLPLFFCLSAFLITKLLLIERQRTGTVALPQFYKRRVLRIWPLYFGVIAVSALFSFLHHTISMNGPWYLAAIFMLANLSHVKPNIGHLWSISVEEQFYVVWPVTMKKLSKRSLAMFAVFLIILANGLLWYSAVHSAELVNVWLNTFVQAEFFAAGILLALWDDGRDEETVPLKARLLLIPLAIASWIVYTHFFWKVILEGFHLNHPLLACAAYMGAAIVCVGLIAGLKGIRGWPPFLLYLGKISYGLYVFHIFSVILAERIVGHRSLLLELVIALLVDILIAHLSYKYYESFFLKLKEKFELVKSRPV